MAPIIRVNATFLVVYRLRNTKDLETFLEELSAMLPRKEIIEIYQLATKEPYSFLYINLVAKKKEDMMFIRFEHKMVLDTNDGADPPRLEGGELDGQRAGADIDPP